MKMSRHLGRADTVDGLVRSPLLQACASRQGVSPAAAFLGDPPSRAPIFFSRAAAAARYEVGAEVEQTVTQCAMASSRSGGPAFSSSTVEAPMCNGNTVEAARPKVSKRRAADEDVVGQRTSTATTGNQAAARHHVAVEVIVAFGWPVVPEVKANRQVSSAAVSTFVNGPSWRAMRASRPSAAAA